ncbi:hypothetical protein FVE85_2738 [Porphyridium purpureum]|uniref:Uncharacterized protein n=1 Tax=Porphyridium purpureum TaxID=35688 RepID=A0A5J4YVR5_PORPP|nr:hypothetical protein FVE85_2738 [Porphyridium purpureum]|eukprot:POR2689..scf227_4
MSRNNDTFQIVTASKRGFLSNPMPSRRAQILALSPEPALPPRPCIRSPTLPLRMLCTYTISAGQLKRLSLILCIHYKFDPFQILKSSQAFPYCTYCETTPFYGPDDRTGRVGRTRGRDDWTARGGRARGVKEIRRIGMDSRESLAHKPWHRRREKRLQCDGVNCDFSPPEGQGLSYTARVQVMREHKLCCRLRVRTGRIPYANLRRSTAVYGGSCDDDTRSGIDFDVSAGIDNHDDSARDSDNDGGDDFVDPEEQIESDDDLALENDAADDDEANEAERMGHDAAQMSDAYPSREIDVETLVTRYAKRFERLLDQKTLRQRLQHRDDSISKYVRTLTGIGSSENIDIDDAVEVLRFKSEQEMFMHKHAISTREALELKSMEMQLLRITTRTTLRYITRIIRRAFTDLRRNLSTCDASLLEKAFSVMQTSINESAAGLVKRASTLLFTHRSKQCISDIIGNTVIDGQEAVIEYGAGKTLHGKILPRNVVQKIRFREPMELAVNSVVSIIREYGLDALKINLFEDQQRKSLVFPQDGNLCVNAARRIAFEVRQKYGPDPPEAVLLPLQIYADEAHMTQNGRHTMTPLKIRIVHRRMFCSDAHREPHVVAYLPAVDTECVARAFGASQNLHINAKLARRELESSMYHAIMSKTFYDTLAANKHGIPVTWQQRRLLFFPIVYKLSMDMPMMSKCSFTKASFVSGGRAQKMPCHQCMVQAPQSSIHTLSTPAAPHQTENDEFWVTRRPLQYRSEKKIEHLLTQHLSEWGASMRKAHSLQFIGEHAAIGWNRFDENDDKDFNELAAGYEEHIRLLNRGRFQLTGIDGLHGFLAFWFRGITVAGLKALLSKPNVTHRVANVVFELTEAQERAKQYSKHGEEEDAIGAMASLDRSEDTCASAGESNSEHGSESNSECASDIDGPSQSGQASPAKKRKTASAPPSGTRFSHSSAHGRALPLKTATPKHKGSATDQLRGIIDSAAGKAWSRIATNIMNEASFRRHAVYTRIRSSNFLLDLTKLAEQSYSLGHLLQMVVLIQQEDILEDHARIAFTNLAIRCIQLYGVLYLRVIPRDLLIRIPSLTREVQSRLRIFTQRINLPWNAPKIHALSHFGDNLADFGPMKFWDTTDGEKSFQVDKVWFKSLVGSDTWKPHESMLRRAAKHQLASFSNRWLWQLTRDAYSNEGQQSDVRTFTNTAPNENTANQRHPWYRHRGSSIHFSSSLFGVWRDACTVWTYTRENGFRSALEWQPQIWNPYASRTSNSTNSNAERVALWARMDSALKRFAMNKFRAEATHGSVVLEAFRQMQLKHRRQTVECIVAHPDHYKNPRWDFVEYSKHSTHPDQYAYGKCILIARITINTDEHNETFDVAVIQDFEGHDGESSKSQCASKCMHLEPVFHHQRLQSDSVQVIDATMITGRVTAFQDTSQKLSRWYYFVNPNTFEGVQAYN